MVRRSFWSQIAVLAFLSALFLGAATLVWEPTAASVVAASVGLVGLVAMRALLPKQTREAIRTLMDGATNYVTQVGWFRRRK